MGIDWGEDTYRGGDNMEVFYSYEIVLNDKCNEKTSVHKAFSFNRTSIDMYIDQGKATFRFQMKVKRSVVDFLLGHEGTGGKRQKSNYDVFLFRDLYRKAILLHAILYNSGMEVSRIVFMIDGEIEELSKDKNPIRSISRNDNFPYVFSMISDVTELGLDSSWKKLADVICATTKTFVTSDLCFSSMYSYLASKNKFYYVDRFTCLWTSMNAYYSFIADCYGDFVKKDLGEELKARSVYCDEWDDKSIEPKGTLAMSSEAKQIGLAAWMTYPEGVEPKYTIMSDDPGKLSGLWEINLGKGPVRHRIDRLLQIDNDYEVARLYEVALEDLRGERKIDEEGWKELSEIAEKVFNVKLFIFLLYIISYNQRCNLLHGDSATLLISMFGDPELSRLNVINYFLYRFLNKEIPKMFDENYWTDGKNERAKKYSVKLKRDKNAEKNKDGDEKVDYSVQIKGCVDEWIKEQNKQKRKQH